jgi:DNA-binding transcriptional regulator GbsR (MarR family)
VVFFYVNEIQNDRMMYDKAMSEMQSDKNRAILRSRKSEEKIKQLEIELNRLKSIVNL